MKEVRWRLITNSWRRNPNQIERAQVTGKDGRKGMAHVKTPGPIFTREGEEAEFRLASGVGLENMATVNRQAGGGAPPPQHLLYGDVPDI